MFRKETGLNYILIPVGIGLVPDGAVLVVAHVMREFYSMFSS